MTWTMMTIVTAAIVGGAAGGGPIVFVDATAQVGLAEAVTGALNHGVAWGDFDGDGRFDLFLGNFADRSGQPLDGINRLFRQVGGGRFEPFSCPAVERKGRCSGAVFVDLDNDGDLDLYFSSNTLARAAAKEPQKTAQAEPSRLLRNDGGGQFTDISQSCGACPPDLFRTRDIGVFDFDNDGLLDLFLTEDLLRSRENALPHSRLFRNLGGLRFSDVTSQVGLPGDLSCLGIAVADLNGDRLPDFFTCESNRLYLSQPGHRYREAQSLRAVFDHRAVDRGEDIVTGASFGDLDRDGDFDLITGSHFFPSRVHVYLNEGKSGDEPRFREITGELGIPVVPNKTPHTEIADFDNDGLLDLYWSAWFAEGERRWPFVCRGLGVRDGLPRFDIPSVAQVRTDQIRNNLPPSEGLGMVYYVDGPALDYDGDGDLDFFAGIWPKECSRFFRNETPGGHWLGVRVEGRKMNRMGIGAAVRLYQPGKAGDPAALLGYQDITLNGGYSSGRPAIVHFGLGPLDRCDVEVTFPSRPQPVVVAVTDIDRVLTIQEP